MTKDELRAVLEGGKHHQVAQAWLASDEAVLQINYGSSKWDEIINPSFTDGYKYRIKPETLRYRVALCRFSSDRVSRLSLSTSSVNTLEAMESLEQTAWFVRWLGDWQEIEVNHA